MTDTVISVERLGKKYLIGHEAERQRYKALRDVLAGATKSALSKLGDILHGRVIVAGDKLEEFWALKDVSFNVRRGEVVGIIGRNGAGKSTLLKLLSRISEPSEGRIEIRGRVASLLEVGTGFHPELTGRENIYLNGAILGMSRGEIKRKFDEIVDFSGVEKFLDTPVKRYSSGMYVRLAFAVAAHLEPEILVVDEVLAVGDAEFQRKCLGKMQDAAGHGRTVLFVSHNMAAVEKLCTRALLIDGGKLGMEGQVANVVSGYFSTMAHEVLECLPESDPKRVAEIRRIALCDDGGLPLKQVRTADAPYLHIELFLRERRPDLKLAVALHDSRQEAIFSSCPLDDGLDYPTRPGHYHYLVSFPKSFLMPQRYSITVSVYSALSGAFHNCVHALVLDVLPSDSHIYSIEPNRMGVVQIHCHWTYKIDHEFESGTA